MPPLADATGSVVSAVLFGAFAGSGALPFQRTAFEATIRRGGVGVESSVARSTPPSKQPRRRGGGNSR